MVDTFDDAEAEETRKTQYFEMMCNRAIYHDGWVACSAFAAPWGNRSQAGVGHLFRLKNDIRAVNALAEKGA